MNLNYGLIYFVFLLICLVFYLVVICYRLFSYQNKNSLRLRFIRWLARIFKLPENVLLPKWLQILQHILFPLEYFYLKQSGVRYDMSRDIYFIHGQKYSRSIFNFLNDSRNHGQLFELIKEEDGIITIRTIPPLMSKSIRMKQTTHNAHDDCFRQKEDSGCLMMLISLIIFILLLIKVFCSP